MNTSLVAASSAFSGFGLLLLSIPITVLIVSAKCLSPQTCRSLWLFVSGGTTAMAAVISIVVVAENRGPPPEDNRLATWVYVGACVGAVLGALGFRMVHRYVKKDEPADKHAG